MSRYELAPSAAADLLEIIRYSKATWGAARAQRYRDELELAVQQIALVPAMGHLRKAIAPGLRSFPVAQHVAFYIQRKDRIIILRILHPRMNANEAFEQTGGDS
jgi:toxin ParE1/3/4